MKRTFASLLAAFTLRDLWIIALFLFVYYLNPGLGTPLYYHMTDDLEILARVHRDSRLDQFGGLDRRRAAVPPVSERHHGKGAAEFEHCARHRDDRRLPAAVERGPGGGDQLLQRHRNHDRLCRDLEPGRGLLPASGGRLRLCGVDVGHQLYGGLIRKSRFLSVRTSVSAPTRSPHPGVGRIYRGGIRFCAVAASRRTSDPGNPSLRAMFDGCSLLSRAQDSLL